MSWAYPAALALLGGVLFLAGQWPRVSPLVWSGDLLAAFGLALFAWGTYVLGFVRYSHLLAYRHPAKPWLPVILLVALGLLLVGSLRRLARGPGGWGLLASFMAMTCMAGAVALAPEAFLRTGRWELSLAILIWVLQITFALCLVWAGMLAERPGWVNLGTFLFAIQVITRYFDLFVTMLDTGLLFILGGALLLGVGYLTERKRRQLITAMAAGRTQG